MTSQIRDIPPSPRRVRWSAVVCFRWPFLVAALFFGGYGGLVTLMLWMASQEDHPRAESRLDAAARIAPGTILRVGEARRSGDRTFHEVEFSYTVEDMPLRATCKLEARPDLRAGARVDVEYDPSQPHWARIAGGFIVLRSDYFRPFLPLTLPPGAVLLAFWATGVWSLRRLLRHGDVAVAEALSVERRRGALDVRFRFRDHRARIVEGRARVAERSAVGDRRIDGTRRVCVVHDRDRPERHRLVGSDDFGLLPAAAAAVRGVDRCP